MKFDKHTRIGIIGAGAAGLSTGHYLKQLGYENITVLEKEGRIGGKCCSLTYRGKSYDLGANYITSSYKEVKKLARHYGADVYTEGRIQAYDGHQIVSLLKAVTKDSSLFTVSWQAFKYVWKRWQMGSLFSTGFRNIHRYPQFTQPFKQWLDANKLQALEPVFQVPVTLMGYGNLDEIPTAYALTYMKPGTFINLLLAAVNTNIIGYPKRFIQGYERLFEKISWELEVLCNVEIKTIRRKDVMEVDCMVHEQKLDTIVSTPQTFTFDYLIVATPFPSYIDLLEEATAEERALAGQVQVNPFVVTTYQVEQSEKLFACTFSLPEPPMGQPFVVTRQFKHTNLVSFYTRFDAGKPIPKEKILANNKLYAESLSITLPNEYLTYSTWAYFPHVNSEAMQDGFYERLEALQGRQNTFFTGGLLAFELVECIAEYSKALVNQYFK